MKTVILINMGAPSSPREMKIFLRKMFMDKHILPMRWLGRLFLSRVISNTRYRKSWQKYLQIGGSPLKSSCEKIVDQMQLQLGFDYKVIVAYSYSKPFIKDVVNELLEKGESNITVVSMYPQASFSTTRSLMVDVEKANQRRTTISYIPEYFSHPLFIKFWNNLVLKIKQEAGMKYPTILFSAHSVPEYQIDSGDTYVSAIHESARLIALSTGLPYEVGFQSRVGRMEWVGPDTRDVAQKIIKAGNTEILIVPISFLTENLETLYDIDREIIPSIVSVGRNLNVRKVSLEGAETQLVELFKRLILELV